jgi:hypothetical protein
MLIGTSGRINGHHTAVSATTDAYNNLSAKLDFIRHLNTLLDDYVRTVEFCDSEFFTYFDDPSQAVEDFLLYAMDKTRLARLRR